MVFIKGKTYIHPGNCDVSFEVLEIIFQCEIYADLKVRWMMKSYNDCREALITTYEDSLRIDGKDFDKWHDLYH